MTISHSDLHTCPFFLEIEEASVSAGVLNKHCCHRTPKDISPLSLLKSSTKKLCHFCCAPAMFSPVPTITKAGVCHTNVWQDDTIRTNVYTGTDRTTNWHKPTPPPHSEWNWILNGPHQIRIFLLMCLHERILIRMGFLSLFVLIFVSVTIKLKANLKQMCVPISWARSNKIKAAWCVNTSEGGVVANCLYASS